MNTARNYIPEPQPVRSDIEVTALYYPGTEQMAEWDQVEQTRPEIKPLLGWYDESNPEVVDWQIKWAVEHGISSFCVDWYWNQGVQRLDHWIKAYYKAKFRKYLKWYMMYANHNEVGSHSSADTIRVTKFWIENYFRTPEYYTINGKPAVVIWAWQRLDQDFINEAAQNGETLAVGEGCRRALELSDKVAKEAGLPGIAFINMYRGVYDQAQVDLIKSMGFVEQMVYNSRRFYPETAAAGDTENHYIFDCSIRAAAEQWEDLCRDPKFPLAPGIPTGWNDQPRSFQDATVIYGKTPERFRRLCQNCRNFCEKRGFRHVVLAPVNEWQEGSYIEPNQEYGFGMYDALRDVFCARPPEGFPPNLKPEDVGTGPYDYPPMLHLKKTAWNFSSGVEGWYRNPFGTAYLSIVDNALHFFLTGTFPKRAAIRTRIAPVNTADFDEFRLCMRITPSKAYPPKGDEVMTLFWGTLENPIISKDIRTDGAARITTSLMADGKWHEYTLDVGMDPRWKGMVNELWFKPGSLPHAYVDIRWMRFSKKQ